MTLAVCDRFKCLPSQALKEGASVFRLLSIEQLGTPPRRAREEADGYGQ